MEKLPEEFKAKWVAALRSGKYKQGTGCLCAGYQYCCLGVAALIAGLDKETIEGVKVLDADLLPKAIAESEAYKSIPELLKGSAWDNETVSRLALMNDGGEVITKHSFGQIADYIEQHL